MKYKTLSIFLYLDKKMKLFKKIYIINQTLLFDYIKIKQKTYYLNFWQINKKNNKYIILMIINTYDIDIKN